MDLQNGMNRNGQGVVRFMRNGKMSKPEMELKMAKQILRGEIVSMCCCTTL